MLIFTRFELFSVCASNSKLYTENYCLHLFEIIRLINCKFKSEFHNALPQLIMLFPYYVWLEVSACR